MLAKFTHPSKPQFTSQQNGDETLPFQYQVNSGCTCIWYLQKLDPNREMSPCHLTHKRQMRNNPRKHCEFNLESNPLNFNNPLPCSPSPGVPDCPLARELPILGRFDRKGKQKAHQAVGNRLLERLQSWHGKPGLRHQK